MRSIIYDYELKEDMLPWVIDDNGEKFYEPSWDEGEFSFWIDNNTVKDKIRLKYKDKWRTSQVIIPDFLINQILEHHRMTHEELSSNWETWNKMIIKAPKSFIPLGKDQEYVTYTLEENII